MKSPGILSPRGTMFVHEGAECRVSWRQAVRTEVIAASVGGQVQRYPMFTRFVAVVSVAHEGDREANFLFPNHDQAYLLNWPVTVALGKGDMNIDEQRKSQTAIARGETPLERRQCGFNCFIMIYTTTGYVPSTLHVRNN